MRSERRVHLGSWTFFCDISGRVRQTIDSPIVTTAAVAVPVDLVSTLRTRMRRLFPGDKMKWKYGGLAGLERIVDVLVTHDLALAVYQLHIGDAASWIRYFEQGKEFMSRTGDDAAYLQPSMTLRMRLLAGTFAQLFGRMLRARYREEAGSSSVELRIVTDTDFRDEETEEQFCESVLEWSLTSRLIAELGVHPEVREARCETEQSEPLLLLADYIAGVYHHADPRTNLEDPVVSAEEASAAVLDLRRRLEVGRLLFENPEDFHDEYPLEYRGGRTVRRGGEE